MQTQVVFWFYCDLVFDEDGFFFVATCLSPLSFAIVLAWVQIQPIMFSIFCTSDVTWVAKSNDATGVQFFCYCDTISFCRWTVFNFQLLKFFTKLLCHCLVITIHRGGSSLWYHSIYLGEGFSDRILPPIGFTHCQMIDRDTGRREMWKRKMI